MHCALPAASEDCETCPVVLIIPPPLLGLLPTDRVPSCSMKEFCFAAMLPSNHCICPFISLAAAIEVTHVLLELLPIGTSQKEVTMTSFLLTSVLKALTPSPTLSI